jgi:hypothetical protein
LIQTGASALHHAQPRGVRITIEEARLFAFSESCDPEQRSFKTQENCWRFILVSRTNLEKPTTQKDAARNTSKTLLFHRINLPVHKKSANGKVVAAFCE